MFGDIPMGFSRKVFILECSVGQLLGALQRGVVVISFWCGEGEEKTWDMSVDGYCQRTNTHQHRISSIQDTGD